MTSEEILKDLLDGNRRFAENKNEHRTYSAEHLEELAVVQTPKAAVIACSDSRVVPEQLFDQPLGSLFVSRVPANVASDGTKWMIDIAVGEFKVWRCGRSSKGRMVREGCFATAFNQRFTRRRAKASTTSMSEPSMRTRERRFRILLQSLIWLAMRSGRTSWRYARPVTRWRRDES